MKARLAARETVVPIVYPSTPPESSKWVLWADASLAQDQEGKSQMAWVVAKADANLMAKQKGWIAPVAWSSHRLKRVATSTLLAALIAIAESIAEAKWLLHGEVLCLNDDYMLPKHQDNQQIVVRSIMRSNPKEMANITIFTDNKAAFDIMEAEKPTFSGIERKAALETIAVRAVRGAVRWLPHHGNLADGLTKMHGNISGLVQTLRTREFEFVQEQNELKARASFKAETGRKIPRPNTSGLGAYGPIESNRYVANIGTQWVRVRNKPRKTFFVPTGSSRGPGWQLVVGGRPLCILLMAPSKRAGTSGKQARILNNTPERCHVADLQHLQR
eukprot:5751040-Amphidinium_carterae.1